MNKPAKILIAVALLAFAATGLYQALRPATNQARPPVAERREAAGERVPPSMPPGEPRETLRIERDAWPTPVPTEPSHPAAPVSPTSPDGFRPVVPATGELPPKLDGFERQPSATPRSPLGGNPGPVDSIPGGTPAMTPPALRPVDTAGKAATPPTSPPVAAPPAPVPVPKPPPAKPVERTYTVKEGDSLASIWRELSGSERGWERLRDSNPGIDPSRLKIGLVLKVPEITTPAASPKPPAAAAPGEHVVKAGDTLSSVAAERLGSPSRWREIYDANKSVIGADPAALKIGMRLTIPGAAPQKPASGAGSPPKPPAPPPAPVGGAGSPPTDPLKPKTGGESTPPAPPSP